MFLITSLPSKVICGVLRELDRVQYLVASIYTCKHYFLSFRFNPALVFDILQHEILSKASNMQVPRSASSIRGLLDILYNDRHSLTRQTRHISLQKASDQELSTRVTRAWGGSNGRGGETRQSLSDPSGLKVD